MHRYTDKVEKDYVYYPPFLAMPDLCRPSSTLHANEKRSAVVVGMNVTHCARKPQAQCI